jgi:transposase-like protein
MPSTPVSHIRCPNKDRPVHGRLGKGNILRHGFFKLKQGARRRRYRCTACGKTFASTEGTPYYRLHCTRRDFDEVAAMSVEGVSESAVSRIKGISWNTVARWLGRAAIAAGQLVIRQRRGKQMSCTQDKERLKTVEKFLATLK